jgi:hypothetical protein
MTDTTSNTEAVNGIIKWLGPDGFKRLGQFFEMSGVIALTFLLGPFLLTPPKAIPIPHSAVLIIAAIASFAVAVFCSYSAEKAQKSVQQDADTQLHIISEARLSVLKDMSVPESVRSYLRSLISAPEVGEKLVDGSPKDAVIISGAELVSELSEGLGPEVSRRFKDKVLEHTLWDKKHAEVPSAEHADK